ncbi:MAG: 4-hydroxybenzoate octaprenyltransferase [Xanthomonadales bacterium]|nr:4-hydroxybenzoate octaprenyltransferase [Xanthomonadales bacterium]
MSDTQLKLPQSRLRAWWQLMRFDRPIGILLLLWPTLWALWAAAGGPPSTQNLVIFLVGVVVMRAAGCVANDLADRDFDPHVERTRERPLAAGTLSPAEARAGLLLLLLLAFGLVLMTNRLTVLLAIVGAGLALIYPLCKRFMDLPQAVLGVAFGWSVPMAFAAETGAVPALAWWLLLFNVFYSLIYDTWYAMVDRADDLAIGVRSSAILFGRYDRQLIAGLQLAMLVLGVFVGWRYGWSWPWFLALALCVLLFAQQQWIARRRDRQGCFRAFMLNNWIGLVLFLGLLLNFSLPWRF